MEERAGKRILDIIVSGLGILITSPIMLIIAICVKAYDRGPVFYYQDRLTYKGKEFKICKFRSMFVDSEKQGARLASKNDSRITPFGKCFEIFTLMSFLSFLMYSREICLLWDRAGTACDHG